MEGIAQIRDFITNLTLSHPPQEPSNTLAASDISQWEDIRFEDDQLPEHQPIEKIFTCAICLESSQDYEADWYDCVSCTAQCCTKCLADYLQVQTGESKPLCCPDPSCESQIPESVALFLVGAERLGKHKKHIQMKEDPDLRECPHCGVLNSGNADAPDMVCSSCSGEFCFLHDVQHAGRRCTGIHRRGGGMRSNLYLSMRTTKCPGCKLPVQRTAGCPHMTCSKCNTDFCYHCGKETPAGTTGRHNRLWSMECHSTRTWSKRAGTIAAAPVVAGVAVAAAGIAIGLSPIAVPVYLRRRANRRARRH
eukprot:1248366-Rhodomonas_salina.1